MKIAKKIFRILGTILLIFLIAIVILMFNAHLSGEAPSVFGYQIFRVTSGSMSPQLEIGDIILVKKTDFDEIKKGDIITYKGEDADLKGKFITHMVIEKPQRIGGEYTFTTRGTAPDVVVTDPPVHQDQVLGVYIKKIPFVNHVYNFFLQPYGLMTFIFIIIGLFAYELIALILSYKHLDEPDDEDDEDDEEEVDTDNEAQDDTEQKDSPQMDESVDHNPVTGDK